MSSRKILLLSLITVLALALLAMPVSNFFLSRKKIEMATQNPSFLAFSQVLQSSCVDCHSTTLVAYPLYAGLPFAKTLIARDLVNAQARFVMTESQLSGLTPFSGSDLSRIASEVESGRMPLAPYRFLHWNATLDTGQKDAVLSYVKSKLGAATF